MKKNLRQKLNISVIIPAYNAERTIERTLLSVLDQSAIKYIKEVIIINDGSIDLTEHLVKSVIKKHPNGNLIKYFAIKNGGVSNARNIGIESSTGNWIALLDSDDSWTINKIDLQVKYILRYPAIRFIGSNSQIDSIAHGKRIDSNLRKITFMQYMLKSSPSTGSIMFERKLINEVGIFDINQKYAEDSNLFMRMIYSSDGYYLEDKLLLPDDKPAFGASGLSANLKAMHQGCLKNISDAQKLRYISFPKVYVLVLWEYLRYIRRRAITSIRRGK